MIILVVTLIVFGCIYYILPLIRVIGDSMFPTYLNEEVIVGTRIYRKSKLKTGDVIIYKTPTDGKIVIKRIDYIIWCNNKIDYVFCLGDNADHSYDSRHYGFVPSENIVCKVINQRRNTNHDRNDNSLCD